MQLPRVLCVIGLSLAVSPAFAQNKVAPVYAMTADGDIHVATDGHVSDYHLRSELPPAVSALVDRAVRGWQFEPVIVEGAAVNAKTALHLGLIAEPQGDADKYMVRITEVSFGEPSVRKGRSRPPHYPESAVHAHLGARVLLKLHLDDSGNVAEVFPYQASLDARANSEAEANRYRKLFEEASIRAARDWQFDLTETLGGKPVGTWAIVPLVFGVTDHVPGPHESDGRWRAYIPGPIHDVAETPAKSGAGNQELVALKEGEARALDSRFHLKRDVIGTTL